MFPPSKYLSPFSFATSSHISTSNIHKPISLLIHISTFFRESVVRPSAWKNFKGGQRKENVDPSICPVIVLVDGDRMRIAMPDQLGRSYGRFMAINDGWHIRNESFPIFNHSPQSRHMEDIVLACLTEAVDNVIELGSGQKMVKTDGHCEVGMY